MTPDGYRIYAESQTHPSAFVAMCYSGVALAATSVVLLAEAIAARQLPPSLEVFYYRRLDVPQAA
jgi:hypothetical protein